MFKLSKTIISLFGLGFFPFASGTIGTFFSLIFFYFIFDYITLTNIIIIFISIFVISLVLIRNYSFFKKENDSSEIVIDEFLGITFIMIFYEYIKFSNDIIMFILIFFIFRFFDIFKFFPANWIDKNIKNSWGVILDDIVAGAHTIVVLYIISAFL